MMIPWLLGLVCLTSQGCAGARSGQSQPPEFRGSDLVGDGLGIGGIVSAVPDDSDAMALSDELGFALGALIMARYRATSFVSWTELRDRVGDDLMLRCLDAHASSGRLDSTLLAELVEAVGDAPRYLVFGRIDQEEAGHSSGEVRSFGSGEGYEQEYLYSTREIRMSFWMYDLSASEQVFFRSLEGRAENSRPYGERIRFDADLEGSLVWAAIDAVLPEHTFASSEDYPALPTREAALMQVFNDLARKLADL
jgi:hypothetical protein